MATPNFNFLNAYNGYLPRLTGQVIAFAQTPEAFSLNQYVQFVQTNFTNGAYQELGRDEYVRVVNVTNDLWEDGSPSDKNDPLKITQRMIPFTTQRRQRSAYIGYKAIEQCEGWKPKVAHTAAATMQTMTAMTQRVATLLTSSANWNGQSADANVLNNGAGNWANASADPASPNYNAIWKTITGVLQRINLLTNNQVKLGDLRFIVNPNLATIMSQTPELVEYCRSSPDAKKILESGLDSQFNNWGLPMSYKGAKFVVEEAGIVTSNQAVDASGDVLEQGVNNPASNTAARRFIFPNNQCTVVSRVGALEGEASGGPNFSTVQIYYYKKRLEVEGFNNAEERFFRTRVTVDQIETLAAPVSGYQITNTQ